MRYISSALLTESIQLFHESNSPFEYSSSSYRALSTDNKVNIIIGVLAVAVGVLDVVLAWAMRRLMTI